MRTRQTDESERGVHVRTRPVRWGCVAASGALYAAAQPPGDAPLLGYVALVPWLCATARVSTGTALAAGAGVGVAAGMLTVPWLPGALGRLGVPAPAALAIGLALVALAAVPPFALLGLAWSRLAGLRAPLRAPAYAFAWLVVETGRGVAPGQVPWGLLGHSQASLPGVAQLAALGGVPAVSACLVLVNASLAVWVATGRRQEAGSFAASAVFAVAAAVAGVPVAERFARTPTHVIVVALATPDIPPEERFSAHAQPTHLARAIRSARALVAAGPAPALLVWPETLLSAPLDRAPALAREVEAFSRVLGAPLALGAVLGGSSPDRYRNALVWVTPERGMVAAFLKTRPVPGVERAALVAPFAGWGRVVPGLAPGRTRVGPASGLTDIVPAICWEIAFARLIEQRAGGGAALIVNVANDRHFGGIALERQQQAQAVFRAIERRLPVVRAGLGGGAFAVDRYGRALEGERQPDGTLDGILVRVPVPVPRPSSAVPVDASPGTRSSDATRSARAR